MRTLLVEDEAEFAEALRGMLEKDRFTVDWVASLSPAADCLHGAPSRAAPANG